MKLLLLNPLMNAEHNIAKNLRAKGVALLLVPNVAEASKILRIHGKSIELAIIHRENACGVGDEGVKFATKLKMDPAQQDLPIILSSARWTDAECVAHQQSPEGVNAYLKYPFNEEQLVQMIEAVLGHTLEELVNSGASPSSPAQLDISKSLVLEDSTCLFRDEPNESNSIQLDAPELSHSATSATQASLPPQLPPAPGTAGGGIEIPTAQLEASSHVEASSPEIRVNLDEPAPELVPPVPPCGGTSVSVQGVELDQGQNYGQNHEQDCSKEQDQEQDQEQDLVIGRDNVQEPIASDAELALDMPYLFSGRKTVAKQSEPMLPLGDAVVPGGAAQSPDIETLKKYLLLREQDVAVLSKQLVETRQQLASTEEQLKLALSKCEEYSCLAEEQKRKLDGFERDKELALEALQSEIREFRFQAKVKTDKIRVLELQVRDATAEVDRIRERVRLDIRKIRVREKELENRLEIMKKDSEALLAARESRIIELKRKVDLLEFNMDLLQNQYVREKETSAQLRERLDKALQAVRIAGGLLDDRVKSLTENSTGDSDTESEDADKKGDQRSQSGDRAAS